MNKEIKLVTWRDSNMFTGQCSATDNFDIATIESVGFVVKEDDEKIVLAGDYIENDVRRAIAIPKENIISIKPSIIYEN